MINSNNSGTSRLGSDNPESSANHDSVILLHGMARTAGAMTKIDKSLAHDGYQVVNVSYPSTRKPPSVLIEEYIKPELMRLKNTTDSKIHFVTHSLGGILVRLLLQTEDLPQGSRIVMLSPPNHGSEIVDKYKNRWWFKMINGPAAQVLGTEQSSLPNSLSPIAPDVGIITGNSSIEPWFSRLIHSEDDGKVSVESAKLKEMNDFLVVNLNHSIIMKNAKVLNQITYFLRNNNVDY